MGQRFYHKASVQVAIVTGIVAVIIVAAQIWSTHSAEKCHNHELESDNQSLRDDLTKAKSEVQRLETMLTPFRTIALEKFTGTDAEVLQKLAEQIETIDTSLSEAKKTIESLKEELTLKTSDRKLTQEQSQSLIKSLAGVSGKVLVKADFADSEAEIFASQIKSVLEDTELEIIDQGYTGIISLYAKGIAMILNDVKNPPSHAAQIQKAFQRIGIVVLATACKDANFPPDAVVIWICHK